MVARVRLLSVVLWSGLLVAAPALAKPADKTTAPAPSSQPVEISADGSLEWYRDQHLYVARDGARAIRGETTVTANLLSAHERDAAPGDKKPKGKNKEEASGGGIDRLTAEGNVHIWDTRQQVFGDKAVYDLDKGIAEVTGSDLKYMTQKEVVTANESLEYYDKEQMAIARGHAIAVRDDRHIEGDVLTAHFAQTPEGQTDLSILTAQGHVTVLTGETVARGEEVVYDVKRNSAVLSHNVRVTRGQTQLLGDKAEVDFATGESRLLNENPKGRVKALLFPQKDAAALGTKGEKNEVSR